MTWETKIDRVLDRFISEKKVIPTKIMLTRNVANPVAVEKGLNVNDLEDFRGIDLSVHNYIFLPVNSENEEQEVIVDSYIHTYSYEFLDLLKEYSVRIYIK